MPLDGPKDMRVENTVSSFLFGIFTEIVDEPRVPCFPPSCDSERPCSRIIEVQNAIRQWHIHLKGKELKRWKDPGPIFLLHWPHFDCGPKRWAAPMPAEQSNGQSPRILNSVDVANHASTAVP